MFPVPIYKIEDQTILEQLKAPKREKVESSWVMSLIGLSYVLGLLLAPLMDYFNIPISSFINITLLFFSLLIVAILYYFISQRRKKRLYIVVELETLSKDLIWIRPRSIKHFFKLVVAYLGFLMFNVVFLWVI